MILGIDYMFLPDAKETDTLPIKLLSGLWKDVIFRYQTVAIKEGKEGASLTFSFKILDPGGFREHKLYKSKDFKEYLATLLNTLILTVVDSQMENNANRDNNPQEFTDE